MKLSAFSNQTVLLAVGGVLTLLIGGLVKFDPGPGLAAATVSPAPSVPQAVADDDAPQVSADESLPAEFPKALAEVIRLTRAGVREDVILGFVRNSGEHYAPTADQLVFLHQAGVSQNVMAALLTPKAAPAAPETATAEAPAATAPATAPVAAPVRSREAAPDMSDAVAYAPPAPVVQPISLSAAGDDSYYLVPVVIAPSTPAPVIWQPVFGSARGAARHSGAYWDGRTILPPGVSLNVAAMLNPNQRWTPQSVRLSPTAAPTAPGVIYSTHPTTATLNPGALSASSLALAKLRP